MTTQRYEIVVIGVSQGGLSALESLLSSMPNDYPLSIAIVQHRSADSENGLLAAILQRRTRIRIEEPYDKEAIVPGRIYLAPPDYHLMVEDGEFALSTDGPVSYARPSIDVLFTSASQWYGQKTIGVVLTGANSDGANGAKEIKSRGGYLIVQDPETAECAIMPRAALAAAKADQVLRLAEIPDALVDLTAVTSY